MANWTIYLWLKFNVIDKKMEQNGQKEITLLSSFKELGDNEAEMNANRKIEYERK